MIASKSSQPFMLMIALCGVAGGFVLALGCNSKSTVDKPSSAAAPALNIAGGESASSANDQSGAVQSENSRAADPPAGLDEDTKLLVTDFQQNMQAWKNGKPFDFRPTAARIVKRLQTKFDLNEVRLAAGVADQFVSAQSYNAAREIFTALQTAAERSDNTELAAGVKEMIGPDLARLNLLGTKPKMEGTVFGGGKFDWNKYKGKVVLLDFWATWCGPCVAELPNVVKAYDKFHPEGFEVVGISLDDDREKLTNFLAKEKLPWTILFDEDPAKQGWEGAAMTKEFAVNAIPATFLVDRAGKIVSLSARAEDLEAQVKKLLSEKP